MPSIQWVKPAPLWNTQSIDLHQPWLAEFPGDRFLPDFLDLMTGKVEGQTADTLSERGPEKTAGVTKLYQPIHGRYYLVTGSLICRQAGLPDRVVARQQGQKTSFVLRRLDTNDGTEQAWVKGSAGTQWQPVGIPDTVLDGEDRLPLHPVALCHCQASVPGSIPWGGRTIHYGYIPVDRRNSYIPPVPDPIAALASVPPPQPGQKPEVDVRLGEVHARVLEVWRQLLLDLNSGALHNSPPPFQDQQAHHVSLYLLLDFGDFLQATLPGVFDAVISGATAGLSAAGKALHDEIAGITMTVNGVSTSLAAALAGLKAPMDYYPLVHGEGTEPAATYDVRNATRTEGSAHPTIDGGYLDWGAGLSTLIDAALQAEGSAPRVPDEVKNLITMEPPGGDSYVLRLVYEYPPCRPIVSDPTPSFTFARIFDPDAPARAIRIELPSLSDLRKFKHGVGMEMSPDLRSLMDRVNPGMLQGGGLQSDGAWQLGMICSFSLPIITLVAFIVMFIFLLALNFIFWWLPFLKICFPIPRR